MTTRKKFEKKEYKHVDASATAKKCVKVTVTVGNSNF